MAFKKITNADLNGKGVTGLPDTPNLSKNDMQAKFDELVRDVVVPKFNDLVDDLNEHAGDEVNVTDPTTGEVGDLNNALHNIEVENHANTLKRHEHANKSVLDAIIQSVKDGYDRIVTLLTGIVGIDTTTLTDDRTKLPSSMAVKDYVDSETAELGRDIEGVEGDVESLGTSLENTQLEVSANTAARHTHENKSVLDAITSAVKTGYDRVVTLFANITGIDSSVTSATNKIPTSKAVKDKTDTMQTEITANTNARHTHSNKSVLDAITSTVKTGYDRLVTLFANITGIDTSIPTDDTASTTKVPTSRAVSVFVSTLLDHIADFLDRTFGDVEGFETTLTNTNDKAPTSHAVKVYVDEHGGGGGGGGGDMYKSTYDTEDRGYVDRAVDADKLGGKGAAWYAAEDKYEFSPLICIKASEQSSYRDGIKIIGMNGMTRKVSGTLRPGTSMLDVIRKNVACPPGANTTISGVRIEVLRTTTDYGKIRLTGTATANINTIIATVYDLLGFSTTAGTNDFILSGLTDGSENTYFLKMQTASGDVYQYDDPITIKADSVLDENIYLTIKEGTTVDLLLPLMFRPSYTPPGYVSYGGIVGIGFYDNNHYPYYLNGFEVPEGSPFYVEMREINGTTHRLCCDYIYADHEDDSNDSLYTLFRYIKHISSYEAGMLDPDNSVWISDQAEYVIGSEPPVGSDVYYMDEDSYDNPEKIALPDQRYHCFIHSVDDIDGVRFIREEWHGASENLIELHYPTGDISYQFSRLNEGLYKLHELYPEDIYLWEDGKSRKLIGRLQDDAPVFDWKEDHIDDWTPEYPNTWNKVEWNGLEDFYGNYVWFDWDNIYYSDGSDQYVLNERGTIAWVEKNWSGLTDFYGDRVWSDGEIIYYSNGEDEQYVLNKGTSTWSVKTWNGCTNINGDCIWSDGENIYYSYNDEQYVLSDKRTDTWSEKTWNGLTDFNGNYIWSDGDNIYYSCGEGDQYVLDKATSTWSVKTWSETKWNEDIYPYGNHIWKYRARIELGGISTRLSQGDWIYYSTDGYNYVLDKETGKWQEVVFFPWLNTDIEGDYVWTDGNYTFYSNWDGQFGLADSPLPQVSTDSVYLPDWLNYCRERNLTGVLNELSEPFQGADSLIGSGGTVGRVPAPRAADANKFLKGDGTWASPTSVESVSVSSNGTKTYRQLLFELFGKLGNKINILSPDSKFTIFQLQSGGSTARTVFNVQAMMYGSNNYAYIQFVNTMVNVSPSPSIEYNRVEICSIQSSCTCARVTGSAVSDMSDTVAPVGIFLDIEYTPITSPSVAPSEPVSGGDNGGGK